MKPAYLLGGLLFVVFVAIGVYYMIPISGQSHFLGSTVGVADTKHALVFFALAIVSLIGARFVANSSKSA